MADFVFTGAIAREKTKSAIAWNAWLGRHARQIVIVIATTIGLYLVARGIVGVA